MELFQEKKENVLAHMIKYYSCSWVFDEKTIKILKGKSPDSFIEELYYMRGKEEYLIFDSGVFWAIVSQIRKNAMFLSTSLSVMKKIGFV